MSTRILDRFTRAAALIALTAAACDDGVGLDAAGDGVELRDGAGSSGPKFNTNKLLGTDVAAIDTTGLPLNGVRLLMLKVMDGGQSVPIDAGMLHVELGELHGVAGGTTYSGTDFIGSVWTFEVNGQVVHATLKDVETGFDAGLYDPLSTLKIRMLDPERLVYTFEYKHPNTQQQIATCAADDTGGARMVLFGDIEVDPANGEIASQADRIYFGCFSGAVGKAALWGYAADSPSLPSLSLAAFETGTRIVRADFCADGVTHTEVGKELTLQDRWGINSHGAYPFKTEAIWEVGGKAKCVSRIRATGKVLAAPYVCADGTKIPLCQTSESRVQTQWNAQYGDVWTRIP